MFIILLVATATLGGLPPSWTVLNCFHLLWFYKLYPLLGWLYRLSGWFYSFAFTSTLTCIIFNLYYYCITVTVLNCFHLLWLYKLYPLLGWLCRLPGWFYSFAFTSNLTCIIFNLYYYCITVLPLPTSCPFNLYGIRATLFWPVIVVLCSLSLHLCLPKTLVLRCCVPFLPSLVPP